MALEHALLRVRMRHKSAGDADRLTFAELLQEARQEAATEHERLARGEDFTARFSLGQSGVKKLPDSV